MNMLIGRQYKLIEILIQDNKWYTLSDLAISIGCGVKTISRDIKYIQQYLPENWGILTKKGKGIYLFKPIEEGMENIDFLFQKSHMTFRVLDSLFYESVSTISDLAYHLYIQPSVLYKHLKDVKYYLSCFNLKLATNPLRIAGDEVYIIFLFCELYFNIYRKQAWPFSALSQKEILDYITEIEMALDFKFHIMDKQKISYFLAILLHRKKQGYSLNVENIQTSIVKETIFYQKIASLTDILCMLPLYSIDKIIITILVNCSRYTPKNIQKYKFTLLQNFEMNKQQVFQYAKIFILLLEEKCELPLYTDSDFVYSILQHLKQSVSKYGIMPKGIKLPLNDSMYTIKQRYLETFHHVQYVYHKWKEHNQFAYEIWEEDIIFVTIQIEAVRLLSQSISKNIYLYIKDHFTWERYIYGILRRRFGDNIQIQPVQNLNTIKKDATGIIVTTESVVHPTIKIVRISHIPTNREIDNIQKTLYGSITKYSK